MLYIDNGGFDEFHHPMKEREKINTIIAKYVYGNDERRSPKKTIKSYAVDLSAVL